MMDIIRNQQHKQWDLVTTFTQLHLDFSREKQRLTLFLDQQVIAAHQWIQDRWDKNYSKNAARDIQVWRQLWCMTDALQNLDKVEQHAPNFKGDIDDSGNGSIATLKPYLQDLTLHLHLSARALTVDCHLCSPTDGLQHLSIFSKFHLGILRPKWQPSQDDPMSYVKVPNTRSPGLDWQMEDDWGDSYHISSPLPQHNQNADRPSSHSSMSGLNAILDFMDSIMQRLLYPLTPNQELPFSEFVI